MSLFHTIFYGQMGGIGLYNSFVQPVWPCVWIWTIHMWSTGVHHTLISPADTELQVTFFVESFDQALLSLHIIHKYSQVNRVIPALCNPYMKHSNLAIYIFVDYVEYCSLPSFCLGRELLLHALTHQVTGAFLDLGDSGHVVYAFYICTDSVKNIGPIW